ncbi:MAG: proton-conducting transporter membrane subunit [bacterium]
MKEFTVLKGFITPGISKLAILPVFCILVPFTGAILTLVLRKKERVHHLAMITTVVSNFILLLMMLDPVIKGIESGGELYRGLLFKIEYFYTYSLSFKVDPVSLLIAIVTNFLWVMSAIYALGYMSHGHARTRYDFFVLLSLMMNLGVLLAGDLLTLFIFFEGLLLTAYPLVIHEESEKSKAAAKVYLYMGVATGLSLLMGIFLFNYFTGSLDIGFAGEKLSRLGIWKYIIAGLMIMGFGGKAGLFFEHVWLPLAHPVAPSPASALLSGAIIKTGAYGLIRVVNMLYLPALNNANSWLTMNNIGYIMIWVGILTMFLGVLNALISSNSKEMLAFHSISQMGYIVMGIGCAAYLGKDGAMGLSGALYHIINHALFKASLFLCAGALYFRTNELDMYKSGGLWRNMPVTFVCLFIAVCGISGIPGFNGFASKTILHHSILEAYEHSVHYLGKPDKMLKAAEIIFMLTAGGTIASNFKLLILTFLGKRREEHVNVKEVPLSMKIGLIGFSGAIIFIGIFPNLILEHIIGPGLSYFGYDPASHPYHSIYNVHTEGIHSTIPILYEPLTRAFFTSNDVLLNLESCGAALLLGGTYFVLGLEFGWFHVRVPEYLTVIYYYKKIFWGFINMCLVPVSIFGRWVASIIRYIFLDFWQPFPDTEKPQDWLAGLEKTYDMALDGFVRDKTSWVFFDKIDKAFDSEINKLGKIGKGWWVFDELEGRYSKRLDKLIDMKKHWGLFKKVDGSYEASLDKVIYNILGLEELRLCRIEPEQEKIPGEKAAPWFMKLTRDLTLVHSGDISTYITWIIFTLTLIIAFLIGFVFIESFQMALFVFLPVFIAIIIGTAFFIK